MKPVKPIYLHVLTEWNEGEYYNEFLVTCRDEPRFAHVVVKESVRIDVRRIPEEELTKWMRNFVHSYWRLSDSDEQLIMDVIDWTKFREILGARIARGDEYKQNKRWCKPDTLDREAINFIYDFCCEIEEQEWKLFPVVGYWSREEEEEDGA